MTISFEMRKTRVVYCDYCKKEINDYSHTVKTYNNKREKHFHSMYKEGEKNCLEKYEEKEKLKRRDGK